MQRDKIKFINELTVEQKSVIEQLRKEEFFFLASMIEGNWKDGRSSYIDPRVPVSTKLRIEFEKLNVQFKK